MSSELVSAEGIYVKQTNTVLLAPTSFSVRQSETLAITGSNGVGKTTLLRVLAGTIPPSGGKILVGGNPINDRDRAFRGLVASLVGVPPFARNLTLSEHMCLVAASWGYSYSDSSRRSNKFLNDLGILQLSRRFPHEISSGQLQLFSIALTLVRPSGLLILDEPEQRLDSEHLDRVKASIREAAKLGATVIMSTHSRDVVETVADRVLNLKVTSHGGN